MIKLMPILVAVLLHAAIARADDFAETVTREPEAAVAAATPPEFRPVKHYLPAYGLGVLAAGTQLWAGVVYGGSGVQHFRGQMVGAVVVSPSIGQIYAGSILPAIGGIVGRAVGAVLLAESDDCLLTDCSGADQTKYVLGLILFGGGIVYGIVDTKLAVDRANQRARRDFLSKSSLSPRLYPVRNDYVVTGWAPGLEFVTSF